MNEKEFYIYLGNRMTDRMRVKFMKEKGFIVDLVIQFEAFINHKWHPIVRYDCAHGFFHRDLMMPNGDKEKKAIEMPELNTAFAFARQDIEDKWKWYKEKYIKKLRNEK